MTQRRIAATAVLAAGLLVGCGPTDTTTTSGSGAAETAPPALLPSSAPQSPAGPSTTPSAAPAPSGLVDEDTGEVITPRAVPQWDTQSRAAAAAAGEEVMRAFARPDLDHESWWAALEPLLSSEAQVDYAYVEPANIPAREVTAEPSVREDTSAYIAHVTVPTDIGEYTVLLSRQDGNAPWLAERITPPEAVG